MARYKTIAGYFQEVIEKQPIIIKQNVHAKDQNGNARYKDDQVTPVMEEVDVEVLVDVKNRIWVDQVNLPLSTEEEEHRDAEEALLEYEKQKPIPLTDTEEMDLLLESGPEAVKTKRAEHKEAMRVYLEGYSPLVEKVVEKHNIVVASLERNKSNAVIEGREGQD